MGTVITIAFGALFGAALVGAMHRLRSHAVAYQQGLIEEALTSWVKRVPSLLAARLIRKRDEIRGDSAVSVQTDRIYRCANRRLC